MENITPVVITTIGLVFDILGALLVANEVVRVFEGSVAIDIGDSGCLNGSARVVPNPRFVLHEEKKRQIMKYGLVFLLIGFVLQGVGAWLAFL